MTRSGLGWVICQARSRSITSSGPSLGSTESVFPQLGRPVQPGRSPVERVDLSSVRGARVHQQPPGEFGAHERSDIDPASSVDALWICRARTTSGWPFMLKEQSTEAALLRSLPITQ